MERTRRTVVDVYEQAYQARDLGKAWEAQQLVDEALTPAAQHYVQAQDALIASLQTQRAQVQAQGQAQSALAKRIAAGIGLFMALLGALLSMAAVRSITTPLAQAVQLAQTIAAGDLSRIPHIERRDDLGQLMQALAQKATIQRQTGKTAS